MSIKFIILGCGSSMGVPRPDGFFGNCDPKNKKNYRTRCSALIKTTDENILIDTSPDLRQQLLRHKIKKIDKVFYSHMHACLLYTSPSPRDRTRSRMPSSA